MPPLTDAYEKLGVFYLGRRFDPATKKPTDDLVLYDSKDLVTHALCVGMTGSGKTGLGIARHRGGRHRLRCRSSSSIRRAISTNLLLTFPDLRAEDFRRGSTRTMRGRAGKDVGGVRRRPGGAVEEGACRMGRGRRTHPAAARRRGVHHLHAGQHRRCPGVGAHVVRRSRTSTIPSSCASARRRRCRACSRWPASRSSRSRAASTSC